MAEIPTQEDTELPWNLTIYAVAPVTTFETSNIDGPPISVFEVLKHVSPKARVIFHPVFTRAEVASASSSMPQALRANAKEDTVPEGHPRKVTNAGSSIVCESETHPENHEGIVGPNTVVPSELPKPAPVGRTATSSIEVSEVFVPRTINEEAITLLDALQKNAYENECGQRNEIILAGYGFGGFVIKQAIILANTNPIYYKSGYDISKLVFFSTAHRSVEKRGWESILLDMIEAHDMEFTVRLSHILSTLVNSVSHLSHNFHKFASKYSIVNFVEGLGENSTIPMIGDLGKFHNDFEKVVSRSEASYQSIINYDLDTIDDLEMLRRHFTPTQASNCDAYSHLRQSSYNQVKNTYFEALRTLSNSPWILHEPRILDSFEESIALKSIYGSLLNGITSDEVFDTKSIQVIGKDGLGKSALLKLIIQDISQKTSTITLDSCLPYSDNTPSLYSLLNTFIHQIISQRPSWFHRVESIFADILLRDAWTEESLRVVLTSLVRYAENSLFLVVIYDYEDWPSRIHLWFSHELPKIFESCRTRFTFITSSRNSVKTLFFPKEMQLDLDKDYATYRRKFIHAKLDFLLDRSYGSAMLNRHCTTELTEQITRAADAFQGSLSATGTYLTSLFERFSLTTPHVIQSRIGESARTEEELYKPQVLALGSKHPDVRAWVLSAVSWTMRSMRTLRLEELAVAAAVKPEDRTFRDIKDSVSMDIAQDLRRHMGLVVAIEDRQAFIANSFVRGILNATPKQDLDLNGHLELTQLCLGYLKIVLKEFNTGTENGKYFQPKSPSRSTLIKESVSGDFRENGFEFFDYACRFWHEHFLQVASPEKDLKDEVASFLLSPEAQKWFEYYVFCHGQPPSLLQKVEEGRIPISAADPPDMKGEDEESGAEGSERISRHDFAIGMSCCIGLGPMISELFGEDPSAEKAVSLRTRRGSLERTIDFRGRISADCLAYAIANDDVDATRAFLRALEFEAIPYHLLHQSAFSGALKVSGMLLKSMTGPCKAKDGTTPLHMAASGGSSSVISLLLGKDASEDEYRITEIAGKMDSVDSSLQTPLIIAVRKGHVDAAKTLLEGGAFACSQDSTGKTALHYAILTCPSIGQSLMTHDSVRIRDNDDCTPLHISTRVGNSEATSDIVNLYEEAIRDVDRKNMTPLHYAAQGGFRDIVAELLRHDEVLTDDQLASAAELAAIHGHLDTVKLLLSKTSDINKGKCLIKASRAGSLVVVQYLLRGQYHISPNFIDNNQFPLSEAAANGHTEIVRVLLNSKASALVSDDKQRKTPLHHAAENGTLSVCKLLLQHRADVKAADVDRKTPLHFAAIHGKPEVIDLLLEKGSSIDGLSRTRQTPLHLAVKHPKSVQTLLDNGADPNVKDNLSQTPLHLATRYTCLDSVELLLRKEAEIEAEDDKGRTALYYAIHNGNLEMVKKLCSHGEDGHDWHRELSWAVECADYPIFHHLLDLDMSKALDAQLFHSAAAGPSAEILQLILDREVDVNLKWSDESALHAAAENGRVENVRLLISKGADVDIRNDRGQTSLHTAAKEDQAEVVEELLKSNANINATDQESRTPVYFAAYNANSDALKILLDHKPDGPDLGITAFDDDAWSPLHVSADDLEATKLLVNNGADPNLPKGDGYTPLHLAILWGELLVVEFLLKAKGDPTLTTGDGQTGFQIALEGSRCDLEMVKILMPKEKTVQASDLVLAVNSGRLDKLQLLLDRGEVSEGSHKWPLDELKPAYWRAITLHCQMLRDNQDLTDSEYPDIVEALIKKNDLLLETVEPPETGMNALKTCLHNRGKRGEEEEIAERLVEAGTNPIVHCNADGRSALELGMISRRTFKSEFIGLCIDYIPSDIDDVKALGIGFKELRIATELDEPAMWEKLKFLRQEIVTESDQDGWSIDHFVHQSGGRITPVAEAPPPLTTCKRPQRMISPSEWGGDNVDLQKRLSIHDDGLVVDLLERRDREEGWDAPITLRANFPFLPRPTSPHSDHLRYFEVKILPADPEPNNDQNSVESSSGEEHSESGNSKDDSEDESSFNIEIGFCGEFTDLAKARVGSRAWTVGYCGEDGVIGGPLECPPVSDEENSPENIKFSIGDTVGCGIDYSKEEYFFTLNGRIVGSYGDDVIFRKLYPVFSHEGLPCKVQVIFEEAEFTWQRPMPKPVRTLTGSRRG
ncbi:ankyrin repeat [Fusarium tjaetaba]|uniref:Ankyrin repeat n=1 Tax=Fusarium tjaetaba TaxID=1567544 RepID=A0A8H5QU18_9HYPO|nr:ankyrin repeat [Fusarium tjaetaba]KAF5621165.1 ankyrin repeat [Fusarium tjaetaba]